MDSNQQPPESGSMPPVPEENVYPTETAPGVTAPQPEVEQPPAKSTRGLMVGVIVLLLTVAGFAAYHFWGQSWLADEEAAQSDTGSGPVATVNGQPIERELYQKNIDRVSQAATAQGLDPSDPQIAAEIKSQVIDSLINTELMLQAAEAAGITPTEAAIDDQMAAIITQFGGEEALRAQMESLNLTDEEVRSDIAEQLAVNQLVESRVDLETATVSDEEIQEFYDTIATQNPDSESLPAFENVRDQISDQLRSQKEQALVDAFIAELRGQAEIEILINPSAE